MKSSVRSVRMARKMRPCSVLSVHSILCAGCQRGHKKVKGTSSHELLSIEEVLKGKMKTSVVHCEKHPQQEINTYCHTDKRAFVPNVLWIHMSGIKSRDWSIWCGDSRRKSELEPIRFPSFFLFFFFFFFLLSFSFLFLPVRP